MSPETRAATYRDVQAELDAHIRSCESCKAGAGFDLCLIADRLILALLGASVPQENDL